MSLTTSYVFTVQVPTPAANNCNVALTKAKQHFINDTVQNITVDHNNKPGK